MKHGVISTVIRLSGLKKFSMKPSAFALPILLLAVLLSGAWWLFDSEAPLPRDRLTSDTGATSGANSLLPVLPLRPIPGLDPGRVALGERLFHDARLSADFSLTCASCHNLAQGGVDGRKVSLGIKGALGGINAPTVLNSGYGIAQFWDGRAASLEEQAAGPIHNPIEMGSNWVEVLGRLQQDADLV